VPASRPFAFLVHPRRNVAEDLARVWRPLGRVPERCYDTALRHLTLPATSVASVSVAGHDGPLGHIVLVPFGAGHLLADPVRGAVRVARAVDHAVHRGARLVGLGALTAPVTAGGLTFRHRSDVGVTNGNAFTAAVLDQQVRDLLAGQLGPIGGRVAVVGATGSVGSAVVRSLARDRAVEQLLLVARGAGRRECLAAEVASLVPTATSSSVDAVVDADLVVLLTASTDSLLREHHLAPGAVVLDATQPRNTSPDLAERRPDVAVVDGGIVSVPSLRLSSPVLGLPQGRAFACLAETVLLSLSGHEGHFSLGNPGLDLVDRSRELAAAMGHLGFTPAPPTTFGRSLTVALRQAVPA
jgi:fatty aldehyde-generating acyl-ACP reductase